MRQAGIEEATAPGWCVITRMPMVVDPIDRSQPNSRVTASALTSSRGWLRWL